MEPPIEQYDSADAPDSPADANSPPIAPGSTIGDDLPPTGIPDTADGKPRTKRIKKKERADRARRDELQERIEFTLFMLKRRLYKSDVKKQLKKRFNLSPRACEIYIARARELYLLEQSKTRLELRSDSLNFYESVLSGPDSTLNQRVYAQERIDRLMALEHVKDADDSLAGEQSAKAGSQPVGLYLPPVLAIVEGEQPQTPAASEGGCS